VSGYLHALVPLPLGKNPKNPLNRRVGWPQSQSRCFGEEKNLLPIPGFESQTFQLIA